MALHGQCYSASIMADAASNETSICFWATLQGDKYSGFGQANKPVYSGLFLIFRDFLKGIVWIQIQNLKPKGKCFSLKGWGSKMVSSSLNLVF